ncbi:MAG: AAA family ATPase, partial [Candidatus Peribacteraceae bacterium]|nr:AAA family ATPase [Candidatus Peribacteraceae bacterium]
IGASGTGKSTYRNSLEDFEIYSWDDLRLEFYSQDYDEAFKLSTQDKNFGKKVNARFMELVKSGKNIYVDNVNVSKKRRAFFIREAKRKGYFTRAVVFPIELDVLIARQETRSDKTVPGGVVAGQYRAIQTPQFGEFDDIDVKASNLPNIA